MPEPAQFSTAAGTISGSVNGHNENFSFTPAGGAMATEALLFVNGALVTQPGGGVTSGNSATVTPAPSVNSTVTIEAWTPDPITPINPPVQFTTANGSITGVLNGANNIFTLATGWLVTDVLVFWNGSAMVVGRDFSWTCLQNSSAGPWVTTITMMAGNLPLAGDTLTAEAFLN